MTVQVLEMSGVLTGGLVAALMPALAGTVAPECIRRGYPRDAMAAALSSKTPSGLPVVGILLGDLIPAKDAPGGSASRPVPPPISPGQTTALTLIEMDVVQQQVDLIVVAGGAHGAQQRDTVAAIIATTLIQLPSLPLPDSPTATADGSLGPTTYKLAARVQPLRDRTDPKRDDDGLYRRDLTYTLRYTRYAMQTLDVVQSVQYSLQAVSLGDGFPASTFEP